MAKHTAARVTRGPGDDLFIRLSEKMKQKMSAEQIAWFDQEVMNANSRRDRGVVLNAWRAKLKFEGMKIGLLAELMEDMGMQED